MRQGAGTRVASLHESGSARLRWPATAGVPEAVLINTAGGIVSGDVFRTEVAVGVGAHLVATTASAERVYKSEGETAVVDVALTLGAGASLAWLPQELILFDRARLRRSLAVACDGSAELLLYEATVFGRAASSERIGAGLFRDRWRVRRDGRLVYADEVHLDGAISDVLDHPALGGGCRAVATLLHVAPGAPGRLEEARALLEDARSACGASAWNGMLVVRWLAPEVAQLRADAARFIAAFRGAPMPRVWQC